MEFTCPCCRRTEDTEEAHCALHMAAPKLLAALQDLLKAQEPAPRGRDQFTADCIRNAKRAIAEAEGRPAQER